MSTVNVPPLILVFWPRSSFTEGAVWEGTLPWYKNPLLRQKIWYFRRILCHTRSKAWIKEECLLDCSFWGKRFVMNNSFDVRKIWGVILSFDIRTFCFRDSGLLHWRLQIFVSVFCWKTLFSSPVTILSKTSGHIYLLLNLHKQIKRWPNKTHTITTKELNPNECST